MMQLQPHNQVAGWPQRNQVEKIEMFYSGSSSSNIEARWIGRSEVNQELNQQLQMKADELEKLFSAHKVRVNGAQMGLGARSQLGDVQLDAAVKNLERRQRVERNLHVDKDVSMERNGGLFEYDANLLLKMVDNLEHNLKQSQLGVCKGDFYDRYLKLRDCKLTEEKGVKGIPKRMKIRAIEDSFEQSWAQMKKQFGAVADRKDLEKRLSDDVSKIGNNQEETVEPFMIDEQAQNSREISSPDNLSTENYSKNLLNTTTNSSTINSMRQPEGSIAHSLPNSKLRKQNVKLSTGLRKVNTPLPSKNSARSKSNDVENTLVYEDDITPRSSSKNSSSADHLKEIVKDLSSINSSPSAPLKVPKEQSRNGLPNRYNHNREVKPFLRRGAGRGAGARSSAAKLWPKRSSETQIKEDELDDSVKKLESKPNLNIFESEELVGVRPKVSSTPFQFELENEEARTCQESQNSGDLESESSTILDSATQRDNSTCENSNTTSTNVEVLLEEITGSLEFKARPFLFDVDKSSVIDDSFDKTTGREGSRTSHHPNLMKDAAQARIQWESTVKPNLDGISSQPRKDLATGLKRLFNFRKKNKFVEKRTNSPISTASKHDDHREKGGGSVEQSTDDLSNLKIGCLASSYTGLNEGKIFPEQVNVRRLLPESSMSTNPHQAESSPKCNQIIASRSLFAFPSFRRRGSESKAHVTN